MMRAMWSSVQGLRMGQSQIDAAAHNLANLHTPGFRALVSQVSELGYDTFPGALPAPRGIVEPDPFQLGAGARVLALRRDQTQGPLSVTGSPLDLALTGEGFFALQLPDGGVAYTRNGSFRLDEGGAIVNHLGYRLLGAGDAMEAVPTGSEILVSRDGEFTYQLEGEATEVGRVAVYAFNSPEHLQLAGDTTLRATAESGQPRLLELGDPGGTVVHQGHLESANTELAMEMVTALVAQRAYQFNARTIRTLDEMWRTANDIRV